MHIACLDLRDHSDHGIYVAEVKRLAGEFRHKREAKGGNGALKLSNVNTYLGGTGITVRDEVAVEAAKPGNRAPRPPAQTGEAQAAVDAPLAVIMPVLEPVLVRGAQEGLAAAGKGSP